MSSIPFKNFKSFSDFQKTLLDYHILIPENKSLSELKLFSNMGYKMLFNDTCENTIRLVTFKVLDLETYVNIVGKDWQGNKEYWNRKSWELSYKCAWLNVLTSRYNIVKEYDFTWIKGLYCSLERYPDGVGFLSYLGYGLYIGEHTAITSSFEDIDTYIQNKLKYNDPSF